MEPHGLVLQKHKDTIIKAIVQSQQTVGIIYELSRRNVFEESVVEALMGGETTETNRARHLISQLQQGSSEAFNSFVSVLKQLGLQEEGDILLSLYDKERNGGDVIDNQSRVMPSIRSEVGNGAIGGENGAQFNNNLEEPFIIRVIPSTDIVTEERDNRDVYKNSSMPRGLVFLANYKFFKDNEHPIRNGSEKDVQNLSILFNQMGYKIPHQHHNLTFLETHRKLQEFAELPELASVDSCIIVIMSHGRDEESFYAHDNQVVKNQDVINYFNNRNCLNLRGKPKIFIFQHCRGKMQDFGVQSHLEKVTNLSYGLPVEVDGASQGLLRFSREPTYTDLFLIYSTVGGYVSFRHPDRGSWLIEAICLVFMSNAYKLDLDALMKKVSQEVRKNYADGGEKQICEYVSRGFDRHFFFNPVPLNENLNSMEMTRISRGFSGNKRSPTAELPAISHLRNNHRGTSPTRRASWDAMSRNQDPTLNRLYPREYNLSSSRRHRHSSGGSSPSLGRSTEDLESSGDSCISTRLYPHLGFLGGSMQVNNFESNDNQYGWNRTISEPASVHWVADPNGASNYPTDERPVFPDIEEQHEASPSPGMDYDVVDCAIKPKSKDSTHAEDVSDLTNTLEASSIRVTEERSVEIISKIENTTGIKIAEKSRLKRQLSIPSSRETLSNLYAVKKFFQVNDANGDVLDKVTELEIIIRKQLESEKKKKPKLDKPLPNSLEY